ncbi:MAG: flagellar biosynthesis protein FlhF [Desulfobacterales bacterium]|nr:flagellar biosynthesis protein FlhF [Desulfobacterales bacterium]MBF0396180.1 flagellar biosynthesis protein FlhF [Desulfobacterales bacterium]
MEAKSYRARSIQDAVSQIKQELGSDAIILSTKRIPKNSRDPYGHDMFEVIAAKPSSDNNKEDDRDTLENLLNNFVPQKPKESQPFIVEQWHTISSELVQIKDMLFLLNQNTAIPDILNIHPECLNIYAKLVKCGISEKLSQEFLKKSGAFSAGRMASSEEVSKSVILEILSSISVLNPFDSKATTKHIVAFVGPTGVGKTTTLAKLAAELSLKQNKNVGLISIDSYRIGAVEQLKTYASIMGLPCLSAFTRQDLQVAIRNMQNKDVILIDTAGHSHLDEKRMKEIGKLIEGNSEITSHLLLSATTKISDMKEAASNFTILNPKSYIFTKLDETKTRGGILDQITDLKLPISFITNGQRVPEDIMPANKKNIVQLILS